MMAKKTKELVRNDNVNNHNGDSCSGSNSSNIFNTLFGNLSEQQTAASLFSDENPFRRKVVDLPIEGNKAGGDETADSTNLKKEKKKRVKKPSIDSDSDREESKRKKLKVVGAESKEMDEDEKEKTGNKKRKRDMLEAAYEARRYGTPVVKDEGKEEGKGGEATTGKKRKKIDDPATMMVSKEGFDDEAKLLRTIFVGNLPLKLKKKSLLKEFSQFGEVESVRIRSVPLLNTKLTRKGAVIQNKINDAVDSVHAYVVFKTEEAAQASLTHNMSVVGGNHIRVDRACPPRKKMKGEDTPLYDCKRTIFVGNIPFDSKEEEVYQVFSGVKDLEPNIEAIRLVKDALTSMGKGIAYVLFKNQGAANLVVRKHLKLRGRDLRLSFARPETTPSNKRKEITSFDKNNSTPAKKHSTPQSGISGKASTSYQGLRASKSGTEKKGNLHKSAARKPKLVGEGGVGQKRKERSSKRPAVLARKAKALSKSRAAEETGRSPQTGKKRKMTTRTPETTQKNKKPRKFR